MYHSVCQVSDGHINAPPGPAEPRSAPAGKLGLSSCLSSGGGVRDASRTGALGRPRPGRWPTEGGPPPSPWKFWLVTRKISIASVSLDSRALR